MDDDLAIRQTYLHALRELAPLQAANGMAARQILLDTPVDIVLCDLQMPEMGGLELMKWAAEHCPHPMWIVVSGQGTLDTAVQALKLGAFDFICKPIQSPLQLQTVVANAARHQALMAERAQLQRSLVDHNLRLAESHRTLEAANAMLRDQQALLDQDLQRAERILRALLPHALRSMEQMHVNVAYRPSKSIGGDFFGAAMLDDRYLAVYVADAAGHGVSAALLAVLVHQHLSQLNAEAGLRSPAKVLGDLNHALLEECRASGLFVTVVYVLVDTSAHTATVASAGHPPGILLHRNGALEHFETTGPALGLEPEASYGEHQFSLIDEDRLLLYTDGFPGALLEGAPRLEMLLRTVATRAREGRGVIDHLLTWATHDECAAADDDMTLLLLTASPGVSSVDADQATTSLTAPIDCSLSLGGDGGTTWVIVRGHSTWKDAAVLREACLQAFDAGRHVVVDLASCTMLDSTMLGTLHELVVRAAAVGLLSLQRVDDKLRALFVELEMTQVLSAIAPGARLPPTRLVEPRLPVNEAASLRIVLHAHELLAKLSPHNAAQFQPVIDGLLAFDAPSDEPGGP